jgi:hypothetical protein
MPVDIQQRSRGLIEETFGMGKFEVFDELCSKDYLAHDPLTGDSDLAREKENCRMCRTAFPDVRATILASYTDGEVCVIHWRMPGPHREELMGCNTPALAAPSREITLVRLKRGKIEVPTRPRGPCGEVRVLLPSPMRGIRSQRERNRVAWVSPLVSVTADVEPLHSHRPERAPFGPAPGRGTPCASGAYDASTAGTSRGASLPRRPAGRGNRSRNCCQRASAGGQFPGGALSGRWEPGCGASPRRNCQGRDPPFSPTGPALPREGPNRG